MGDFVSLYSSMYEWRTGTELEINQNNNYERHNKLTSRSIKRIEAVEMDGVEVRSLHIFTAQS